MTILIGILLLVSGFLIEKYFLKDTGLLQRIGYIVFFSLTAVPFVNINCALLAGVSISNKFTLSICLVSIVFFSFLFLCAKTKNRKAGKTTILQKDELLILTVVVIIAVFFSYYYTNKEFILSLSSYFFKGDASCFYMQTFETVKEFMHVSGVSTSAAKVYGIICTPGNILFTSTFFPIFKMASFKLLYISFMCLLLIFTYLTAKKLLKNKIIAVITAVFALFNPYILSVEALDRNVMALVISAILFYLVLEYKDKTFFHGLVFGILAGTGLRFLPLLFIIPIIILYYAQRPKIKDCLPFIPGFIITFTFNIPHLLFHGFNSLGETGSSLSLILEAFTKWKRTPFLPFPNPLFYILNILNYFGYLICAILLVGILKLWKTDKKLCSAFSLFFLAVLFILSYQRNWIEGDKYRIIISAFLPLYMFFAYGMSYLFERKYSLKKITALFICFVMPVIFVRVLSGINFPKDAGFYERKALYQSESQGYYALSKGFLLNIGVLPNYKRLFYKLNLENKAQEEKIVFERLFPEGRLPWGKYSLGRNTQEQVSLSAGFSYVRVDFDKLAIGAQNQAKEIERPEVCAIDLSDKENIFDVYYASLNVGWQKEPLPVSVILYEEDIKYLKVLNIDLNAFLGAGKDEAGFDVIYPIGHRRDAGMSSFPLYSEQNSMVFKVPDDLMIVIRYWFINEKGAPFKADSWCVSRDKNGDYKTEFFYNEPESYL